MTPLLPSPCPPAHPGAPTSPLLSDVLVSAVVLTSKWFANIFHSTGLISQITFHMLIYSSDIIFFSQCTGIEGEIKASFDLRARPWGSWRWKGWFVPGFAVTPLFPCLF